MRWLIPVGATSALLVLGYSRGRDYGVHTPVKGKTIAVKRDRMVRSIVAVGKIEPLSKVELKSKASGIIKALTVDIGDRVRAGQMLAELDKDNLSARVREAKAALAVAVANHQSALAEREKRKIESEQPELELARRNYSRASELFGEKLISRAALDESRTGLESATARQAAARASLAVSNAQIVAAEAAVQQATAVRERCEEELRNATLISPIDGVVLARNVEIGSPVSSILQLGAAATLVMTLGDSSTVYFKGKVDESDISQVRIGLPAAISVEGLRDRRFLGRVTRIAPMGDEKENVTTFEVRVSIGEGAELLKANMSADAQLILEERPNVLIVPDAAVTYEGDRQASVEVPDPTLTAGRRRVPVKLGFNNGGEVEVSAGLTERDRVIVP